MHSALTAWCSNMVMPSSCCVGCQQFDRANNSRHCRVLPELFKYCTLVDDSLLLHCEFAHHWHSAILECNHQHSPASIHKTWHLDTNVGTLKERAQLLKLLGMSSVWVRTDFTVAHLEDVPATSAPLKTRPSSSFRLALVLDMGLAFAKS